MKNSLDQDMYICKSGEEKVKRNLIKDYCASKNQNNSVKGKRMEDKKGFSGPSESFDIDFMNKRWSHHGTSIHKDK